MNKKFCDDSIESSLRCRFLKLWQRCQTAPYLCDANPVFHLLYENYATHNRYYHDLTHLLHCLNQFDLVTQQIPHSDAVEMALWFHDAVYSPGSPENEQHSCELFLFYASDCFSKKFVQMVKELILVTTHTTGPKNEDECFIVDIDLSSMGSEWNHFLVDSINLRREQHDISDASYFHSHTRFLKSLLVRERIFFTEFFYSRYEQTALDNIHRLLAKRKMQGYL